MPQHTSEDRRGRSVADVGRAVAVMGRYWREPEGFTVPHPVVYPWLWSWDSSFHSIIWLALGRPDRARRELRAVFRHQRPTGFVPHMAYGAGGGVHRDLWGEESTSTITQPPVFGHAVAVLARAGVPVGDLVGPATAGLRRLFERRATPCGLLRTFHPWESGTDDSPRWERWQTDPFDRRHWWEVKGALVRALRVEGGEAVGSDRFDVCSAGWNALVAWNAAELASVTGDVALARRAETLGRRLDELCWDEEAVTWIDVTPSGQRSSTVRTADALLGVLVTGNDRRAAQALDQVTSPAHFGARFGPAGVHSSEPSYTPGAYWRGVGWPPLDYLWRVAADRRGWRSIGDVLDRAMTRNARVSGFSEYRQPETGQGLGASPQAWGFLSIVARETGDGPSPSRRRPGPAVPGRGPPVV